MELGTLFKLKESWPGGLLATSDVSILNLLFETNDIDAETKPINDPVVIEPKDVIEKKSMGNVISIVLIEVKLPEGALDISHEKL